MARSGPWPVAQDAGSFWPIAAHGSTVIVTLIVGWVLLNSATRAS